MRYAFKSGPDVVNIREPRKCTDQTVYIETEQSIIEYSNIIR